MEALLMDFHAVASDLVLMVDTIKWHEHRDLIEQKLREAYGAGYEDGRDAEATEFLQESAPPTYTVPLELLIPDPPVDPSNDVDTPGRAVDDPHIESVFVPRVLPMGAVVEYGYGEHSEPVGSTCTDEGL